MLRALVILALIVTAGCSKTTVEPSILDTVRCVRSPAVDARAGLDVWDDVIVAYERADAEKKPEPGQVVLIGSSSVVFWQSSEEDLAPLAVLNRGFGGSVTRQATGYVDRIVLPYDPSAVVLYEGDNDIAFGMSADCVLRDVEAFVAAVQAARPGLPVYVLAVKPSIARAHLGDQFARANDLIAAFARETPDVTFIDVATPMRDSKGRLREDLFVEDGLHMNRKGYDVWKATIRPVLLEDLG